MMSERDASYQTVNAGPCGCNSDKHHQRRGRYLATVRSNVPVCKDHFRLTLHISGFPPSQPGQFVQIGCRDPQTNYEPEREFDWQPGQRLKLEGPELQTRVALLRRPFSLGARRETPEGAEVEILHRVVGVGTSWLAALKVGQCVDVIGPIGNSFQPPPGNAAAILVGGGVGIPPMIYLAAHLAGRRAVVFSGAMTRDLLPLTITADAPRPTADGIEPLYNVAEFSRHGIPAVITTNDGSYGYRGLVTAALEEYLDRYFPEDSTRKSVVIYTCGPEAMMKRVSEIAMSRRIEYQVSVERAMACGMGTCQSCVIRVRKPDPSQPPLAGRDWCYRLACTDGPVFRGADLIW